MNTEWRERRERGEHLTSAPLSRGEELLSGLQRHQRVQTNTRSHTHLLKEILPSVDSPLGGSWSRKEKKRIKINLIHSDLKIQSNSNTSKLLTDYLVFGDTCFFGCCTWHARPHCSFTIMIK